MVLVCAGLTAFLHGQTPPPAAKPDTSGEAIVFERISNLVRFEDDGDGPKVTGQIWDQDNLSFGLISLVYCKGAIGEAIA